MNSMAGMRMQMAFVSSAQCLYRELWRDTINPRAVHSPDLWPGKTKVWSLYKSPAIFLNRHLDARADSQLNIVLQQASPANIRHRCILCSLPVFALYVGLFFSFHSFLATADGQIRNAKKKRAELESYLFTNLFLRLFFE